MQFADLREQAMGSFPLRPMANVGTNSSVALSGACNWAYVGEEWSCRGDEIELKDGAGWVIWGGRLNWPGGENECVGAGGVCGEKDKVLVDILGWSGAGGGEGKVDCPGWFLHNNVKQGTYFKGDIFVMFSAKGLL